MIFRKLGNDVLVNNMSLLYVLLNDEKCSIDYVLTNRKVVSDKYDTIEERDAAYLKIDTTGLVVIPGKLINAEYIDNIEHLKSNDKKVRYSLTFGGYIDERFESAEKATEAYSEIAKDNFIEISDNLMVSYLSVDGLSMSETADNQVEFLLGNGKTVKKVYEDAEAAKSGLEEIVTEMTEYEYKEPEKGTPELPEEAKKQTVSIKFIDEEKAEVTVDIARLNNLAGVELLRVGGKSELTGEIEGIAEYELVVKAEGYNETTVRVKAEEISDYTLTLIKKVVILPLTITVTPATGLKATLVAKTKVADISATGGIPTYTYELAGGTDDEKFEIEGSEVKNKEKLANGQYTIKVKVIDAKLNEKVSTNVVIKVELNDITEVFSARDQEAATFNKFVKDLQENNVTIEKTGEGTGKAKGTLKYVSGWSNPAGEEGNWIAVHIDNTKLPEGAVKFAIGAAEADPDTKDWNLNVRVDNKQDKVVKIKINGEVTYSLDLSEMTLMPNVTKEMVKEKLDEAAQQVNTKMSYAKLSVDDNNAATCTITDGTKKVFEVYKDIISTIFDVLKKNANIFAEITGGEKSVHIKADSNIDAMELVNLVKAVLPEVGGQTTIKELYDQTVSLQVVATDGDKFDWTLKFVNGNQ